MAETPWPDALARGLAEAPLEPEAGSGDRAVFAACDGGALVAVVDGLGHGAAAGEAAAAAAAVLTERPGERLERLVQRCHAELRRTRGAVMTIARFDLRAGRLTWIGVGNVEGRLVRSGAGEEPSESALTRAGVVGYSLPELRAHALPLRAGDLLILATDGVAADFSRSLDADASPQTLAERVLREHRKPTDDALVVAVRYEP